RPVNLTHKDAFDMIAKARSYVFLVLQNLTSHRHKNHGSHLYNVKLPFQLCCEGERLEINGTTEGYDDPAALLELLDERRRDMVCRCRNDNRVKRRLLFPTKVPVAAFDLDIPVPEISECL